jgi:hypothetical protein
MLANFVSRRLSSVVCALPLILGTAARAQDDTGEPPAEAAAASVDEFEPQQVEVQSRQVDGGGGGPRWVVPGGGTYYSATLRGHFRAQWMFIRHQGRQINFWGARIIHLDPDSPVRQLGLSPGDVITRLDGVPVARGMFREDDGPWQIVQMERHFGRTEVRYIHRGTNWVNVGDMMLDGGFPGGDGGSPIAP